jgi:hypothetical protein
LSLLEVKASVNGETRVTGDWRANAMAAVDTAAMDDNALKDLFN